MAKSSHQLDAIRLATAGGLTFGFGAFILGLCATYFNWGVDVVILAESLYKGYTPTLIGSVIGATWAFVDGFVGLWIFAWIYNRLHV